MKPSLTITSLFIKAQLPSKMLECYTNFKKRKDKYKTPVSGLEEALSPYNLEPIGACFCEPVLRGALEISYYFHSCGCIEKANVPVHTSFLTTLIRDKRTGYKVSWVASLS